MSKRTPKDLLDLLGAQRPPRRFAERVLELASARGRTLDMASSLLDAMERQEPPSGFTERVMRMAAERERRGQGFAPAAESAATRDSSLPISGIVQHPLRAPQKERSFHGTPEPRPLSKPPARIHDVRRPEAHDKAPEADSRLVPGSLIGGRYRLRHQIGRGAMGSVWSALNEITYREVALKFIIRPDDTLRRRLEREAHAYGCLAHKNIVDVLDMGQTESGEPFLIMQLLSGESLESMLARKRRLDPMHAALLARDVARALAAAHAVGIIHRDIKPANIFLHEEIECEPPVVKVLDFGVCKDLGTEDGFHTVGEPVGSPIYMSPEQALMKEVDGQSDIWSLGVVLFEMLTGVNPFKGGAFGSKVLSIEIPLVSQLDRNVDEALVQIVASCLYRDRHRRIISAEYVVRQLDNFIAPAGTPYAAARPSLQSRYVHGYGRHGEGPSQQQSQADPPTVRYQSAAPRVSAPQPPSAQPPPAAVVGDGGFRARVITERMPHAPADVPRAPREMAPTYSPAQAASFLEARLHSGSTSSAALLERPIEVKSPTDIASIRRAGRRRWAAGLLALTVAAGVAFGLFAPGKRTQSARPEDAPAMICPTPAPEPSPPAPKAPCAASAQSPASPAEKQDAPQ